MGGLHLFPPLRGLHSRGDRKTKSQGDGGHQGNKPSKHTQDQHTYELKEIETACTWPAVVSRRYDSRFERRIVHIPQFLIQKQSPIDIQVKIKN